MLIIRIIRRIAYRFRLRLLLRLRRSWAVRSRR